VASGISMGYYWGKSLAIVVGSLVAFHANSSVAQITPDTTLPNNTKVNLEDKTFNITGGTSSGGNLFHSFKEFSIPTGSTAFFKNGADIQNIINRVTGGNLSNIDGLIKANGSASVFLINPSGIVFGENARLDIGGSFIGSTAESIKFSDGTEFSAINPQSEPLLTVNVPLGLQYGINPGSIQVRGDGQGARIFVDTPIIDTEDALRVQEDKTLALIGGDVNLEGATLKTAGGRIELGSVGENSLVNLVPTDNGFTLDYSSVENFRDIQLFSQATVDASGEGGGDIQVQGKFISLNDSSIEASTLRDKQGGKLVVNATDLLEAIGSQTRLGAIVDPGSTGDGGDVAISATMFVIQDGAQISTLTRSEGKGGNLLVNAETIEVIGTSADGRVRSGFSTQAQHSGDAGDLTIDTARLVVQDGALIDTLTRGEAKGGNLLVNAETIEVIGTSADGRVTSGLSTQTQRSGDTGDLTIDTARLVVKDGAQISAGVFGSGRGGRLKVTATETIEVIGRSADDRVPSGLFSSSLGLGDAADLTIDTARLFVQDGAQIDAGTRGSGRGGNLNVTATETIEVIGRSADGRVPSGLFSSSEGLGDAGDLTIDTARLVVRDGAQIDAGTRGSGRGGNLKVTATETIEAIGTSADSQSPSGLFTSSKRSIHQREFTIAFLSFVLANSSESLGNAGDLTIDTARLVVRDGAQIDAGTLGSGRGGNLNVTAETIEVIDRSADGQFPSRLLTSSRGSGDAGNLNINTNILQINQGEVSVQSDGEGNAGDLKINVNFLRLDNDATVSANTQSVNKDPNNPQANININSQDLILRRNSNITTNATGENVIGGNIDIDSGAIAVLEKSIISANSTDFRGGIVNINTQGLFGTQPWYSDALRGSITATGATPDLSGDVQVNAELDPGNDLVELPVNVVDASNQISNACTPGGSQFQNEFVVTGRGGLPMSPTEPLQESNTLSAWVRLNPQSGSRTNTTIKPRPRKANNNNKVISRKQIVEATGWIVDKDGNIEFVADASQVNSKIPSKIYQKNPACKVN